MFMFLLSKIALINIQDLLDLEYIKYNSLIDVFKRNSLTDVGAVDFFFPEKEDIN